MLVQRVVNAALGAAAGAGIGAVGGPAVIKAGAALRHGRAGWAAVAADQALSGAEGRKVAAVTYAIVGAISGAARTVT